MRLVDHEIPSGEWLVRQIAWHLGIPVATVEATHKNDTLEVVHAAFAEALGLNMDDACAALIAFAHRPNPGTMTQMDTTWKDGGDRLPGMHREPEEGITMKVFVCTGFLGRFPVGTAAIITAPDYETGRKLLDEKLKEAGLDPLRPEDRLVEVNTEHASAGLLLNGDY